MINKKIILEKIVNALSGYVKEIELKSENNLLDDNVFSEDFIKDLLNVCMGWNLVNLNENNKNYPGIDLGDIERHIGVQVTSTKTGNKIKNSLDKIINNNVDKEFYEIYFFILGEKQKSYSIDFNSYNTIDCSEKNIWDISDIISLCVHYDLAHMMQVWNLIKKEIVVYSDSNNDSDEIRKSIIQLKDGIQKVFNIANILIQMHYCSEFYLDEIKKSLKSLDILISYLDEKTYALCKDILEQGLELSYTVSLMKKWKYSIEVKCEYLLSKQIVEKNLQELLLLIDYNVNGLNHEMCAVIDGDRLFDRLNKIQIDEDILCNQFSVIKFQGIIEESIYRKCKKPIIFFSKEREHYNRELVCRLEAEGTEVKLFENRLDIVKYLRKYMNGTYEVVLVSDSEDMVKELSEVNNPFYIYSISFKNDLPTKVIPFFYSVGNIRNIALCRCFNYNECKRINIRNITESMYRDMLANANDCIAHQLRVDLSGDVYISTITGSEEIDYVKFRWESFDAGNEYVGPFAASDHEYVKQSFISLKKCWEDDVRGYCDYYRII